MRAEMPPPPKLSDYPPRRSTGYTVSDVPQDFTDVFGGPPRTILSHQFATRFSSSSKAFFYEDIFLQPEKAADRSGRRLPQFKIPSGKQRSSGFNQRTRQNSSSSSNDTFGWDDERELRSRSRSKTSSSSALSSEELSPLRPATSDDDVSLFSSKLRPINVRSGRNSTRTGDENYRRQEREKLSNGPFRLSRRRNASPESVRLEPMSNSSFGVSEDDLHFNSPSSVCHSDREIQACVIVDEISGQDFIEQEEDESMMGSYVIEINSDCREWACEPNDIDEAIAWAKDKFQAHGPDEKPAKEPLNEHQLSKGHTDSFQKDEQHESASKILVETQLLDCKIRLWATGKEADIRLLLSSLHNILWTNSGWVEIPLMNIIDNSQVKKAYQKAQLSLHPDKLQQRGATVPQKYLAKKVFSALQDAWSAFVS